MEVDVYFSGQTLPLQWADGSIYGRIFGLVEQQTHATHAVPSRSHLGNHQVSPRVKGRTWWQWKIAITQQHSYADGDMPSLSVQKSEGKQ